MELWKIEVTSTDIFHFEQTDRDTFPKTNFKRSKLSLQVNFFFFLMATKFNIFNFALELSQAITSNYINREKRIVKRYHKVLNFLTYVKYKMYWISIVLSISIFLINISLRFIVIKKNKKVYNDKLILVFIAL